MPDGPGTDVGLGHGLHPDGGLDPDLHPLLLQHIGHSQGVDAGGQHAHVVSPDPLHLVAAVLQAPPEVAAADHHAYLNSHVHTALDHVAHLADHVEVQTPGRFPRQGFAADLQ